MPISVDLSGTSASGLFLRLTEGDQALTTAQARMSLSVPEETELAFAAHQPLTEAGLRAACTALFQHTKTRRLAAWINPAEEALFTAAGFRVAARGDRLWVRLDRPEAAPSPATAAEEPTAVLKRYYGHDAFRPGQESMVRALLAGRDCLGVMPTGAGKSVCYQIPALMLQGVTIVISPLISLMKDQVAALRGMGVPAAFLNSSLTARQMGLAMERARRGAYRVIYVAPERLDTPGFRSFAANARIALIAVDEAHCVSQWGQDFRPDYLRIADFVDSLPKRPPVGAFTATATHRVREDIIRYLRLRDPQTVNTGFDRPNLFYDVIQPKNREAALLALLQEKEGESTIVYCATRKTVDSLFDKLRDAGLRVGKYHAGLSDAERAAAQEDFSYDRTQIMVATNAFGMGIDKSNVRLVVHYNMPRSMEAYYQEAGRAGRDGADAECVLLYSASDIFTARWMIDHQEEASPLSEEERARVRRQELDRLQSMIRYCTSGGCLRTAILRYFGEQADGDCGHCGHCSGSPYAFTLRLTKPKQRRISRVQPTASRPRKKRMADGVDPDDLFGLLRAARMSLAEEEHVPPYIICSDKTLEDMIRKLPRSRQAMEQVYGMGTAKVSKYSDAFLDAIAAWTAHQAEDKA